MNSRIVVAILAIAILVSNIAGCRSTQEDYRIKAYPIVFLPKDGTSTMDAVLAAAVRHKCLPQLLNENEAKCTSSERKDIVVTVKVLSDNNMITIDAALGGLMKKISIDEYNEWVEAFGDEIRAQLNR